MMFQRLAHPATPTATPTLPRRFGRLVPVAGPGGLTLPEVSLDDMDPLAQMAQADAADASLMRLVLCAASATLVLAVASSLL
ncbi:MAG: hypothetical protein HZC37_09680 [Burkholderiales bacterium]|nr:hypothetical protein [Burkholderiales bacterium]